jgi:hypothetical protein
MTLASLNWLGTVPVERQQLKIDSKGFEINLLSNFRILTGMLYGPVTFEELNWTIISSISLEEVRFKNRLFTWREIINDIGLVSIQGISLVNAFPILAQKSLNLSAIDLLSVISSPLISNFEGKPLFFVLRVIICLIPFHIFFMCDLFVVKY